MQRQIWRMAGRRKKATKMEFLFEYISLLLKPFFLLLLALPSPYLFFRLLRFLLLLHPFLRLSFLPFPFLVFLPFLLFALAEAVWSQPATDGSVRWCLCHSSDDILSVVASAAAADADAAAVAAELSWVSLGRC